MPRQTRRAFLAGAGAAATLGVAGCGAVGLDGDDPAPTTTTTRPPPTLDGTDYPVVEEWLGSSFGGGGETRNYDGVLLDLRDRDAVTVLVGTDDSRTAFVPAAIVVSTGTDVRWVWTGNGGNHNVVADPDRQIGKTDYTFYSGKPESPGGGGLSFGEQNESDPGIEIFPEQEETTQGPLTFAPDETTPMDEPGVALYHCQPHLMSGMKGAIVVEGG